MNYKTKGLNAFQLKVIALICMTIDHVGYFMSYVAAVPFWFRIIGRISAPLFFFIAANSMRHTSSRLKFLMRLYVFSAAMTVANIYVSTVFYAPGLPDIANGIFSTIFCSCYIISFGDMLISAVKRKDTADAMLSALALGAMAIADSLKSVILYMLPVGLPVRVLCLALLPVPSFAEGGLPFVLLGVMFYYSMADKRLIAAAYSLFCLWTFAGAYSAGADFTNLIHVNYQWLMILALPLMLMYNGQRGRKMKYLFYIYYPLHIYVLYIMSYWIYISGAI